MKSILTIAVLVLISSISFACRGANRAEADQTGTIAPAKPPQTSTDEAILTQTTEVGEERSPNEGGVLTDSNEAGSASTSTPPAPGTVPPIPPTVTTT